MDTVLDFIATYDAPISNPNRAELITRDDIDALAQTDWDFVRLTETIREFALAELDSDPSVDSLLDRKNKVQALGGYIAKKIKASEAKLEAQNNIAEVRICCEREIGRLIQKMQEEGTLASQGRPNKCSPEEHLFNEVLTLEDIGISRKQSMKWQEMADLPDDKFKDFIAESKENGYELTTASVQRYGRNYAHKQAVENTPPLPSDKYRVIYADPPWKYGNTMPDYFTEQADHYVLMTVKEICEMPVKDIAEDNAVLFLWVTSPILRESFDVVSAWGFEYKSSFVWDKIAHNMGHYNSVRHELLLVCTRGSCTPDIAKLFDSVQSIERTQHSEKPEYFRHIIDTLYPNGKRIELFARKQVANWETYGNEVSSLSE